MTTRIKSTASISTLQEFQDLVDETCRLQLKRERLTVARDEALQRVRSDHDGDIEDLTARIRANVVLAEKFATTHRDSLFGKLKSAATSLATFGFRVDNPSLALLNRKWNWAAVVDAIVERNWTHLLLIKTSPDKDAIKQQLSDQERAAIGTRIDQGETFFIDPKRDDRLDHRLTPDQP